MKAILLYALLASTSARQRIKRKRSSPKSFAPLCRVPGKNSQGCVRGWTLATNSSAFSPCAPDSRDYRKVWPTQHGFYNVIAKDFTYYLDLGLARSLAAFFVGRSVIEFGAGLGCYAFALRAAGVSLRAYDGSHRLPRATQGLVLSADLATNLTLPEADWVLCLEVAEHVPPEFESTFLSNLNRHARKGVVLSWSSERRGLGHRNPQSEAYAIGRMQSLGFAFDSSKSEALRHSASRKGWFRKTLMVFRRERAGRSKLK